MAKNNKSVEATVMEVSDFFTHLSGLVKENYLLSLDTAHSLLEENQKFADAQLEQFHQIQTDFSKQLKATFEKFQNGGSGSTLKRNLDRFTDIQTDYINMVRKVSDNYTKEVLDLSQKTAEKAFSTFDRYMRLFKY